MNPGGGLSWHLRAWRCQTRWQGTCQRIEKWLRQARPTRPELLIIGASAGWMMSGPWLQSFQKVTTFDIDPWAAPLFRWRHGPTLQTAGCQLLCHTGDALSQLDNVLRANPRATVLLDNVLGQLRFVHDSLEQASAQIEKISRSLRGRHWGSLHDAYSGAMQPARTWVEPMSQLESTRTIPPNEVKASVHLPAELLQYSDQFKPQGEWLDHLTANIFPAGTVVHHIAWPFSSRYCHWLQAGWVNA